MRSKVFVCAIITLLAVSGVAYGVGTPVIDLTAQGLTLGSITTWSNTGSAGGSFGNDSTDPQVQDIGGRRCVTFSGSNWMKATFTAPSTITGSHAFTVAGWVYNPSIASEEAYLTWARRASASRCAQFNYGNSTSAGAVTHYSANLGFAGLTGNAPSAGTWHHIAVTYDSTTEKVYVDGTFNNSAARTLNIYTSQPVFLGISYTDTAGATKANAFSGSIASLKVYSEALSLADIQTLAGITLYRISGVVRADGAALTGATVCLKSAPDATVNPSASMSSGADGSYSFQVQPGTYYVAAKKSGYLPKPTPDLSMTVTNADVGGKDFSLTYVGVMAAQPFDLNRIQLLPGIFKDAEDRDLGYLLYLQPDRFLHMFRQTAGLPAPSEAYGGWELESCELRGHAGGHYLSALALMYAATGNTELKTRADYMVAEFAKCQDAMPSQGYNQGYLSAFPESFIDRVEAQTGVWAPYYTLHKIMAGLFDAYKYCGNQQALEVLSGMAAWCKTRCDKLSDAQMQGMLNTEFGGMGEVLANLYAVSGSADHLAIAQRFDKSVFTNPLAQGIDDLPGIHSNTHIPQVIAAARLFELTQQDRYDSIAENFWNICTSGHCYPTGGTSNGEGWQTANTLASELSDSSEETCCTYNMLKVGNHVLSWTADAHVGDYIERALLNHILTAQYPGTALPQYAGMNSYYTSFIGGHWKHFHTPDDNMWCCTGTGFESHARYGDSIYFHNGSTLYVNLFVASELNWSEKGVTIRQDTLFPQEQGSTLTVHTAQPQSLAIRIRIPYWATTGVTVQVNGQNWPITATPSTFVEVNRIWDDSDIVHITLPMSLRMDRFVDNNSLGTIFYGPVLLAGALGTSNFTPSAQWGGGFSEITVPKFYPTTADINDWVKPVGGQPLTFRTKGAGVPGDFTLIPFYKLFDQRYNLYWQQSSDPPDSSISSLAQLDDGATVGFVTKAVTLAPRNSSGQRSTNYFYIEDPDRAAAIRVEGPSVGFDNVNVGDCPRIVGGTLRTKGTTGERYIELTGGPSTIAAESAAPLGMNTRSAQTDINALAKLVTVAGKVAFISTDGLWLTMTDGYIKNGSEVATKVVADGVPISTTKISAGNMIVVTGVISKEGSPPASATRVVLARRVTRLVPPDTSVGAYYKFDETGGTMAVDFWGNGNDATLVNGPAWVAGKYGNAVSLDGSDDHVSLPAGIMSPISNCTVACWVKLSSNATWSRIFDFGTGTATNMFLTPQGGAGKIRYAIRYNGSAEQQIDGTAALPTGSWQHVALTWSANTGRLYVNSVQVGQNTSMTLNPSALGNTNRNYIGRSQYSDPYLYGLVDDFRIYGRALSASEITQLYNGTL